MPIEVRHGGEGGEAAGQIIAQAGQAQLARDQQLILQANQLKQQRDLQQAQIDAHAELQKQAANQAYARTALEHGLDRQIREDDFQNKLEGMKEQARVQASQWEYQYTAQQRQQIAKFNNARQAIQSSASFSPQEKLEATRLIDAQQAGITPAMVPSLRPRDPDGHDPGKMWTDEMGNVVGKDASGNPKLILRYDQSPKYQEMKLKAEQEKAEVAFQVKQQSEVFRARANLLSQKIDVYEKDENGVRKKTGSRFLTPAEINERLQLLSPQQDQPQSQPAQANWWETLEKQGVTVTENDRRLPPAIGATRVGLRELERKYGSIEEMPLGVRDTYMQHNKILENYAKTVQ
jgi:hypothetical protein